MKILGLFIAVLVAASYAILPFRFTSGNAAMQLYGTFHAMGITVSLAATDDPNENAVATVEYRKGNGPYQAGFPLTRRNNGQFVGSLFWLDPGTVYDVRVTLSDPDGDPVNGIILQATASTRAEIQIPPAHNTFVVSPSGAGTTCSPTSPCSLVTGLTRAHAGDEVVLRGGVYYQGEITIPRSGAPGAPIVIRSYGSERAVLDGANPTLRSWTLADAGIYYTTIDKSTMNLVIADGLRLYPYESLSDLEELIWDLPGFYVEGQRLYIHLSGDANPSTAAIAIGEYNRGFNISSVDYIYFLNLTFQHYGQENETRALYFNHASHNLVQGSVFAINNGGIAIKGISNENVIQGNTFYDTVFPWSWDAVKATHDLERGGIFFGNPAGGRGTVIRFNTFHDMFDGFDTCSSEPNPQTDETDIYENLIYNMGDDGLQVDGQCSNVRIWNNTFHDVLVGISFAPAVGGPFYAIRNLIYHFGVGNNDHEGRSFKFNSSEGEQSGAIYLFHNTIDAVTPEPLGINFSSGSSNGWQQIYARNNIWSGTRLVLRNDNIQHRIDLDYDNLWAQNSLNLVRWDNVEYETLFAFTTATSQESNGLNVDPSFMNPQSGDYRLQSTSSLIDAGLIIPGINDHYFGTAPDIGAFESTANAAGYLYLPGVIKP